MLITVVYFKTSFAKNSLDNSPLWRTRRAAGHPRLFLPTDASSVAWRIIVVKALAYSFIYVVDSGIYHFSVVFRRNASQQLDLLIKTLSLKTRVNRELNSKNWHIWYFVCTVKNNDKEGEDSRTNQNPLAFKIRAPFSILRASGDWSKCYKTENS